MKCREFRELMGQQVEPDRKEALQGHAASCAACARLLDQALLAGSSLAFLREADAAEQAPPPLELRLLAVFRQRPAADAAPSRSAFRPAWLGPVAVSATVVLMAILVFRPPRHRPEGTAGIRSEPPAANAPDSVAPEVNPQAPDRMLPPSVRAAIAPMEPAGRPVRPRPRIRMAEGTEFFLTMQPAVDDPGAELQLVRVLVSGRTLERFGLSLNPRAAKRPIKADLLIGPDGLTRAVRFISEQE